MKKLISCLLLIILALLMSVVGQDKPGKKTAKTKSSSMEEEKAKPSKKTAKTKSGSMEAEVEKLVRDGLEAEKRGDIAYFEKLEAPDFQFVDPGGMVHTREQDIAISKSGDLKFESMNIDEMKVRVYGHTAVATGQTTVKGTFKTMDISGMYRWTDVYVKRDGKWQLVNAQLTRVQPEMKP